MLTFSSIRDHIISKTLERTHSPTRGTRALNLNLRKSSFKIRVPFRVRLIRVPYYIGDLKRDPNSENYPVHLEPEPFFAQTPMTIILHHYIPISPTRCKPY